MGVSEAALYLHILVVVAVALVLLVEQGLDQLLALEVLGRNPVLLEQQHIMQGAAEEQVEPAQQVGWVELVVAAMVR
jgi:hypothetical protein